MKYRSGTFQLAASEDIKVSITNPDSISHNFRVLIWQQLDFTTRTLAFDSGTTNLPNEQGAHVDYSPSSASDFSIDITVDSEELITNFAVIATSGIPRFWFGPGQFKKSVS